jgi:hypothetical protein
VQDITWVINLLQLRKLKWQRVGSWVEHLRQHERVTATEKEFKSVTLSLAR